MRMRDTFGFLMQSDTEAKLPIYMAGAGHWENQDPVDRPDGYPLYQWLHCLSGEGELRVNGHTARVKPGTGMFLYPDEPHAYSSIQSPWEVCWITFSGREAAAMARVAGLTHSGVYGVSSQELIVNHMKNALSLTLSGKPLAGLEGSKLVYTFLIDMMKYMTVQQPSVDQSYFRLQPVFDYMEQHYSRDITLEELADQLGLSVQHLCLLFRRILNKRPVEYLNQLRIHKSKEMMLQSPDARIGEIARMVGFETPGYFSTLFKRYEGMTPETFRKLNWLR
ncbi:AraC family transcriptional regulator [Paenibacillus marinisediminis]